MIIEYIKAAMKMAHYERIENENSFYGEIPGFKGLYASEQTLEGCRNELESALEDWVLLSVSRNMELPVINGLSLIVKEVNA
jgi:predicted RNase H-like HicB family nuclease